MPKISERVFRVKESSQEYRRLKSLPIKGSVKDNRVYNKAMGIATST